MRLRFSLCFAFSLVGGIAMAAPAEAEVTIAEAPVTLALTLTHSPAPTARALAGGDQQLTSRLTRARLGNREILESLVARGLIPSVTGWRIVALWTTWTDSEPYAGTAYRFFARSGSGEDLQTVAIPREVLSVEPLVITVAINHRAASPTVIKTGTETFEVYHQATFSNVSFSGLAHGIETGTGRYVKQSGQTAGRYLPNASKLTLQGTFDAKDESVFGVVVGSISYGAARLVPVASFPGNVQTAASLVKTGSGTLTLGGSNTYTGGSSATLNLGSSLNLQLGAIGGSGTLASGTILTGGTLSPGSSTGTLELVQDNTLTLGTGGNFNLFNSGTGSLTSGTLASGNLLPGSFTGTLAFSNGGTVTLGTGQVLTFAPGETFNMATLTSEERLGLIVTPFKLSPDGELTTTPPAP
jgi:autotransporter-associated beta strand protein